MEVNARKMEVMVKRVLGSGLFHRGSGSSLLIRRVLICVVVAVSLAPPPLQCTATATATHVVSGNDSSVLEGDGVAATWLQENWQLEGDDDELEFSEPEDLMDMNPIFLRGIDDGALQSSDESGQDHEHHGHRRPGRKANVKFDVRNAGAVGDGAADDTDAFVAAWKDACGVANGEVYVPHGYTFLVHPSTYAGPCQRNTFFRVEGTIIAPAEISAWDGIDTRTWLLFENLDYLYVQGSGTFNGRGQNWWACKKAGTCAEAPTALTVYKSSHVSVKGVTLVDSQQIHVNFDEVTGGQANNITISAPPSSPNTDGIHISGTVNFTIRNCRVSTGDDCVSIVTGSHNIAVQDTYCGKGCHGISVGSLGSNGSYANVTQIQVKNCALESTTNGLRIKTWQGGYGIAQNFDFENIVMTNVSHPIIIDQFYCPKSQITEPCQNSTSAVKVDLIKFINVTGTSATSTAVSLSCSDMVPCTNIYLKNINLVETSGAAAKSVCANAHGTAAGRVNPPSCLV